MDDRKTDAARLTFVRAEKSDIGAMLRIIRRCVREVNAADYSPEQVKRLLDGFTRDWLEDVIAARHYYEARYDGQLVACGGVSRDHSQQGQSYLTAIFVDPDLRGRGIGRRLVEFLETDEWCLDSRLIEVPSSRSSHGFYLKCGYRYRHEPPIFKDGTTILYKEK